MPNLVDVSNGQLLGGIGSDATRLVARMTDNGDGTGNLAISGTVSFTPASSGTATTSNVAPSTTAVELKVANSGRLGLRIFNDTLAQGAGGPYGTLYIGYGAAPADTNHAQDAIPPGGSLTIPAGYTGAIYGIWNEVGGNGAQITEFTT